MILRSQDAYNGETYRIQTTWTRTVDPTQEPLTLDQAKAQAGISASDDDAIISAYLVAAREAAEGYLGRALFTQTWQYTQSDWSDVMWLPYAAPLQSVTSVQYYDINGSLTTLATSYYDVDTTSEPGRIVLAAGQVWPTLYSLRLAPRIIVTYVAGWSTVAAIPELIKLGMRVYLAAMDADRIGQTSPEKAAQAIWNQTGRVYWRAPLAWQPC